MNKKNVAVVMGGFSDEYIVSLKSGQLIFDELEPFTEHLVKTGFCRRIGMLWDRDIRAVIFTKVH